MAHSNSWDETVPTNATSATSIDDEIRKLRIDIRERCAVDHNLTASDAGAATVGQHKQITFADDIADPSPAGDVAIAYTKKLATGSAVVPFWKNSVSAACRVMLGDANFKVWLYTSTAPVGMKASSAPSDCVLAGVGGSYPTAGAVSGTWTISGIDNHAAHNHQWHKVTAGLGGSSSRTWDSNGTSEHPIFGGNYQERTGLIISVQSADERTYSDSYPAEGTHFTALNAVQSHTFTPGWRPYAAVNKLFEVDLTV